MRHSGLLPISGYIARRRLHSRALASSVYAIIARVGNRNRCNVTYLFVSQQHPEFDASRFYTFDTFDELTGLLEHYSRSYPKLAMLDSVGTSFEGRDLCVLTLTNQVTGPADSKPAMYIDGNIHAGEVTGCNVCLYTIDYLLTKYGEDELATRLLDTTTFYILPRVQPDGAEKYLTTLQTSAEPAQFREQCHSRRLPEHGRAGRTPRPAGRYPFFRCDSARCSASVSSRCWRDIVRSPRVRSSTPRTMSVDLRRPLVTASG